jgi:hypothetical protein
VEDSLLMAEVNAFGNVVDYLSLFFHLRVIRFVKKFEAKLFVRVY